MLCFSDDMTIYVKNWLLENFIRFLYDDIYVGELYTTGTGEIEFRPTDDIPIRTYPVDNDTKGALEIYSMPKKDREGKVFNDRYIIGVDPKSLGLILVIK